MMSSRLRAQEFLVGDFEGMVDKGDAKLEKVNKGDEGIKHTVADL